MGEKLYLTHEDRAVAVKETAGILRSMPEPPLRIISYGSFNRAEDSEDSDLDILVTHAKDASYSAKYKKAALKHLEEHGLTVFNDGKQTQRGRICLTVVDEEFWQDPYRLRALDYNDYRFVLTVKYEGIEI